MSHWCMSCFNDNAKARRASQCHVSSSLPGSAFYTRLWKKQAEGAALSIWNTRRPRNPTHVTRLIHHIRAVSQGIGWLETRSSNIFYRLH